MIGNRSYAVDRGNEARVYTVAACIRMCVCVRIVCSSPRASTRVQRSQNKGSVVLSAVFNVICEYFEVVCPLMRGEIGKGDVLVETCGTRIMNLYHTLKSISLSSLQRSGPAVPARSLQRRSVNGS